MSKIITIAGQKGGIGKSATAVNLAASFAIFEKRTLLIDCDPQGCATQWSNIKTTNYTLDLSSVLSGYTKVADAIIKTGLDYFDIMPAGFSLFKVALKLAKNSGNEKLLRLFIKEIADQYEYILIDSPSSHSFLSVVAIAASNSILVCLSPHHSCRGDFYEFLKMVQYIKVTHNVPLKISGFLFTRCETANDIDVFLEHQNLSDIKQMIFNNFIPEDDSLKQAVYLKLPVLLHDIKSKAASAYLKFSQEFDSFYNCHGQI